MRFAILLVISLQLVLYKSAYGQQVPYSTNNTHLTIWNGSEYIPFFLKGINLGVSVPGTFPGELAATKSDYAKWFMQIKEAGFNCIRLYTLHYPRFYEVIDSFNKANLQNPLLFIQGIWLNEELTGYNHDLFFMTDTFRSEIDENIDCVHGNRFILERQGKAYGNYSVDASEWCLAYIIGREVYPEEILTTNENHQTNNNFTGSHFSIDYASASEVWFTSNIDHLVSYEFSNYNTQRPVSVSSWPTLDPLSHPEETNNYEDTISIDLSRIVLTNAPAGLFISYHAYPYYPDFVSQQSDYRTSFDDYGSNSYKGYLSELKSHYPDFPLIIAEFGVPSSWGVAHYASSGMNHGGFDEYNQGAINIRLLKTIENTNCGGGIHFAWIDEWFKRTWITDPIDYINESRVLWHNITGAEQNFGLVSFKKNSNLQSIAQFDDPAAISELKADANYTYFEMELALKNPLNNPDEMWITLDTYDDEKGESQLPDGTNIPFRSEFALHITNNSANLYVTEAYDTYGIWHNISGAQQLFHSNASDGAPWYIVRWKNNSGHSDVQYIGSLQVNYGFQNPSSKDGVTIYDDKIKIRIPWSLINVVAPDQLRVLNDYRITAEREDTITDGFSIGLFYQNQWYITNQRFLWPGWNTINNLTLIDTLKTAYFIMKDQLTDFNTQAIAVRDSFYFDDNIYPVNISAAGGVLKNDFDLDGDFLIPLITEPPVNGDILLNNDGSFVFSPNRGFNGLDSLKYCLFDGYGLSESNIVIVEIVGNTTDIKDIADNNDHLLLVYPNPTTSGITIETTVLFDEIMLFNTEGKLISSLEIGKYTYELELDLSNFDNGLFLLVGRLNNKYYSQRIIKN